MSQHAKAKNIYERITFEAFVKINLAADRWDSDAIAVMGDPAYYSGAHENVGSSGREFFQLFSRIFVRAMLTPHDGKDSELGEIGLTTEDFLDALEFFGDEAVFRHDIRCDSRIESRFGVSHQHRTLTNLSACSIAQFIYCFE